ncbi:polyprenyl synthetase family protein [Streptomyces sp. NPDC048290]|uniref:polyprenyl synthetase family protein n=1 Tax=Streptomyces sp. NPDC048290 TaxID=3155811 RepID=UPI0034421C0B
MTTQLSRVTIRPTELIVSSCQAIVKAGVKDSLTLLPDSLREVAEFHFGFSGGSSGVPAPGVKSRMRCAILLLMCAAMDGDPWENGRDAAAAWTLMGHGVRLHDDLIDEGPTRYGRPSAWKRFGRVAAQQTGDALLALAFEVLAGSRMSDPARAAVTLSKAVKELCAGQVTDVGFETREDVDPAACLAMIDAKSGPMLESAAALGALCATTEPERVASIAAFGRKVGMLLQVQNDLEDIWRDPASGEVPVRSDLRRRKKSVPVAMALDTTGPDRDRLAAYYADTTPLTERGIDIMADLVDSCGGRSRAEAVMHAAAADALRLLDQARPGPMAHAELTAYVEQLPRY